ncbi:MAG: hypothetical protein QM780_17485 [Hyphomicrobium sp.]|uniref:hypothetical protein n=1 Tax=Hyphomicrobium sp. TaxID=82 RepID=UPI0039E7088E
MSEPSADEITEDQFLEAVSAIRFVAPDLSPIGAAILAALHFGIADDSRAFSLRLGVEHALTLREVTALSSPELGLLRIISRNERSQRTQFAPTDKGEQLVSRATAAR